MFYFSNTRADMQTLPEGQSRGISGPTKRTDVLPKLKKKKNKKFSNTGSCQFNFPCFQKNKKSISIHFHHVLK